MSNPQTETHFELAKLTPVERNDFVHRTLSDQSNWTEDVVAGLMEQAIVAPNPITGTGSPWCSRPATAEERQAFHDMCRKMACKFIWLLNRSLRLNKPGENWIPTQSCVDLTTTGAALTREEEVLPIETMREMWAADTAKPRKTRNVARHFKRCKQCGVRFLATRANQEFHSPKCSLRYRRANPDSGLSGMIVESARTALEAA
jgi:hypothetical protein